MIPGAGTFAEDQYPERAALGAMLLNIDDTVEDALDILGDDPQCFEEELHGYIYGAYMALYRDGDPVDLVSVLEKLQEQGVAKQFGNPAHFLAELTDAVPTSANFWYYAEAVRRRYVKREILKTLNNTGSALNRSQMTEEEAMSSIEQQLYSLGRRREGNRPVPMSEIIPRVLENIRGYRERGTTHVGPPTGIEKLDALMGGFKPGTLNVVAARPSVGKTAVAINISIHAARNGFPVLFFSLEMDRTDIVERMVSLVSRTSTKTLAGDFLPRVQEEKLQMAALDLHEVPIEIVDAGQLEISRLRARCRRYASLVYPQTPLIVIDYLQLSCRSTVSDKKRNELIGDFTRECKQLASELCCPFLLLSQLNRIADDADNPFRVTHCLKDSGNIEEDSDTVTILLKDIPDHIKKQADSMGIQHENAIVGGLVKNKYGPVGIFPLYFEKETQFVQDMASYTGLPDKPNAPVQCEISEDEDLI